jgi:hypothetical protein
VDAFFFLTISLQTKLVGRADALEDPCIALGVFWTRSAVDAAIELDGGELSWVCTWVKEGLCLGMD